MGQKVHPTAARLVLNKNWLSRWMLTNKHDYITSLHEDIKLRKSLMSKFAHAYVTRVEVERSIGTIKIIIFAVKPGIIIGRGGKGLEEKSRTNS